MPKKINPNNPNTPSKPSDTRSSQPQLPDPIAPRPPEILPALHTPHAGPSRQAQPSSTGGNTATKTPTVVVADSPAPIAGPSHQATGQPHAATVGSSAARPLLDYVQSPTLISTLLPANEQGFRLPPAKSFVDVEHVGLVHIEIDASGVFRATAFNAAKSSPPGPVLIPVENSTLWRQPPPEVGGQPASIPISAILSQGFASHLSPANASGVRTLRTLSYADVEHVGTVRLHLEPSGEYRARLDNEQRPSGPFLERVPGQRTWREKTTHVNLDPRLFASTWDFDLGTLAAIQATTRPRIHENTANAPALFSIDQYVHPLTMTLGSTLNVRGLAVSRHHPMVKVQEGEFVAIRPDATGALRAHQPSEPLLVGPRLERTPSSSLWRIAPEEAPAATLDRYRVETSTSDQPLGALWTPDENGVWTRSPSVQLMVRDKGMVYVTTDSAGQVRATDEQGLSLGPILERTELDLAWRVKSPPAAPQIDPTVSTLPGISSYLIPTSMRSLLGAPNEYGLRTLSTNHFVDVQGEGTVHLVINDAGETRAALLDEAVPSGPVLEKIPDSNSWRRDARDASVSLERYRLPEDQLLRLTDPDAEGIRIVRSLIYADIEGLGTAQVAQDRLGDVRAIDSSLSSVGPALEQIPGQKAWRVKPENTAGQETTEGNPQATKRAADTEAGSSADSKRQRLEPSPPLTRVEASLDPYLAPDTRTSKLTAPNEKGFRRHGQFLVVELEGGTRVWLRRDPSGTTRASTFDESGPPGPIIEKTPDALTWRIAAGQDPGWPVALYCPPETVVNRLSSPDSDGIAAPRDLTFVDIEHKGTVQITFDSAGQVRATQAQGILMGPVLQRISDTSLWKVKAQTIAPANLSPAPAKPPLSSYLISQFEQGMISAPDASGYRKYTASKLVDLEDGRSVKVYRTIIGTHRAYPSHHRHSFRPSAPGMEQIPNSKNWRFMSEGKAVSTNDFIVSQETRRHFTDVRDENGFRFLTKRVYVDVENKGTVLILRDAGGEVHATDSEGLIMGPALEQIPGKPLWREKAEPATEDIPPTRAE